MRREIPLIVLALAAASTALAQEDSGEDIETLDLTMELMSAGATTPEAVTRIIELPEVVLEAVRERENGLDEANANRERREDGQANAEAARTAVRERAEQALEDAGRGQPPETVPPETGPPDNPGPPEIGGPPPSPGI